LTTQNNTVLYTGVTSDLIRRMYEYKYNLIDGFTKRYYVHKFVYFEMVEDAMSAIEREKQIKSWVREKKIALISASIPEGITYMMKLWDKAYTFRNS
jgi:putative endonuclease